MPAFHPLQTLAAAASISCVTSDELHNAIYERLDTLKSGSLSFWGHWFGRPYDNIHRIVGADSFDGSIAIYFDHGETLVVDQPGAWSLESGKLIIKQAERVRFQWYYYGKLPGPDSLQFEEYRHVKGKLTFATDFMSDERHPTLYPGQPAVELHTF
jgi:hypothetical protein